MEIFQLYYFQHKYLLTKFLTELSTIIRHNFMGLHHLNQRSSFLKN